MQPHEGALSNGRRLSPAASVGASSELDGLRLACRRQASVIEGLRAGASNLRSGAVALRAENVELRSANERMGRQGGDGAAREGDALEACVPLDARAPGAARIVVGRLRSRVPALVLEDALLVVSELVTNSVRHSGASDGAIVVRVELTGTMVRLEVEDPGRGGVIAPRDPDLGGFGLNLVHGLCERWGLEHVAAGGTRVWAQLARASAPASAEAPGAGPREIASKTESQAARERRAQADARGKRPMTEVHFVPDERTWRAYDTGAPEPDSEHTNASEAELAAKHRDAQRVVIHDRYHRTHDAALSPAGCGGTRAGGTHTPVGARSRTRSRARPRHPLMTSGSASRRGLRARTRAPRCALVSRGQSPARRVDPGCQTSSNAVMSVRSSASRNVSTETSCSTSVFDRNTLTLRPVACSTMLMKLSAICC